LFYLANQHVGFVLPGVVGDDDIDALGGQLECCILAKATAAAGDECDALLHGVLLREVGWALPAG
jgi:hypothetical protein